ncbi:hypothetical protein NIES37_20700 [Tolypothrix tenuis PCC 7101]|uniref:Lipoprotein n=1 Tax=Tolypothrix tenuis PCC 7101 TaxID=231146 RepID=A0A1Z4MXD6_9CYAN|nr:hypothetical protein [Aulosira sp. FACHB-113]BAY98122.1 hypothetical protein NIES37_20700 [Tolypothrix tenuis PCC 7101]BAZ77959.1 hypothetical protein NIES50_65920 [Aulosira laxa NIES-50]
MKIRFLRIFLALFLITTIVSCSSGKSGSDVANNGSLQNTPVATNVAANQGKIQFKTEGGSELFAMKPEADGAKLVDGKNQELARIKADKSGKIKIKDSSEKVLGYIVAEKGYWKLKDANQSQDLYILRRQNDGDYKLEDAAKKEIYRIKARNDGLEIETPDKNLVYQVKVKEGKTSLRKSSSKTIFSTKSQLSPIAFTCFGLDVLTREQQAGLAYAVNLTGGK